MLTSSSSGSDLDDEQLKAAKAYLAKQKKSSKDKKSKKDKKKKHKKDKKDKKDKKEKEEKKAHKDAPKQKAVKLKPLSTALPPPPTAEDPKTAQVKPLTEEDYLLHAPSLKLYLYTKNLKFGDLTSEETHAHFSKYIKKYNTLTLSSIYYPPLRSETLHSTLLGEVNKNSSGWSIKTTSGEANFISSIKSVDPSTLKTAINSTKSKEIKNRPKIAKRPVEVCKVIPDSKKETEMERWKREEREKVLKSIGMSGIKKVEIAKRSD
ncbi:hypothetical protein TrST_g14317 [Triparma strigata]|uniref:Uncharacterized protein n=1 Tax=Triparma strigata TaxID=1606541 RepID=A0A9W6ZXW1_9STRA|nr:hypothetical protein TrST_g14317 [Triparma strigata]